VRERSATARVRVKDIGGLLAESAAKGTFDLLRGLCFNRCNGR
jgi:hypothetical protein